MSDTALIGLTCAITFNFVSTVGMVFIFYHGNSQQAPQLGEDWEAHAHRSWVRTCHE